jgi:hypothetical protein
LCDLLATWKQLFSFQIHPDPLFLKRTKNETKKNEKYGGARGGACAVHEQEAQWKGCWQRRRTRVHTFDLDTFAILLS